MVCPPARGDNPRALARGISPVQTDKPWYNYFATLISVNRAHYEIFHAIFAILGKSDINQQ